MRSYWNRIIRTAAVRASSALGITTVGAAMLRLLAAIALIFGLYFWGSEGASRDELIGRGIAIGFVLLVWPLMFVWQLLKCPAEEDKKNHDELTKLKELPPIADRLETLAQEVEAFTRAFNGGGRPAPNDALNYVPQGLEDKIRFTGGEYNVVSLGEGASYEERAHRNVADQKWAYDQYHMEQFREQFSGRLQARLSTAASRGALEPKKYEAIYAGLIESPFSNPEMFFNMCAAACREAASNLREIDLAKSQESPTDRLD